MPAHVAGQRHHGNDGPPLPVPQKNFSENERTAERRNAVCVQAGCSAPRLRATLSIRHPDKKAIRQDSLSPPSRYSAEDNPVRPDVPRSRFAPARRPEIPQTAQAIRISTIFRTYRRAGTIRPLSRFEKSTAAFGPTKRLRRIIESDGRRYDREFRPEKPEETEEKRPPHLLHYACRRA